MKTIVAIPARLGATRFPKKVLADLDGKPMIQHVYEKAKQANVADDVYVLVDAVEVENAVRTFGGKSIMTSPECHCGTDRIVSVLGQMQADFIINVQGDEPLLDPQSLVDICERAKTSRADIITPIFKITDFADIDDPSRVKVAVCQDGKALYFSRSPIPFVRSVEKSEWLTHHQFWGHIGVYGYRRTVLESYKKLHASPLETAESLEQLKFLDNGYTIDTIVTKCPTIGIDTPEDLKKATAWLNSRK
ncbi:MAG: 3-deoxy-manno-octulosonate cytidylyltransferase [Puniceicoccales bacterium]|jgi:3-deoxy-manno-octulosonate cytidylyltransferase (CMP-KDO synthetase)|nr:3-deoxy-manno-octulosonate cytidylyltransferase [Puniceicoccales bacterium]